MSSRNESRSKIKLFTTPRRLTRSYRQDTTSRGRRGAAAPTGRSIRLNVTKPSGLRHQVMTEDDSDELESTAELPSSRASLGRSSKAKRRVIVDDESDSEDEEEEEEEEEDDEAEDQSEQGEDDESEEADEDVEMSEATPQPPPKPRQTIKLNQAALRKPSPQRVLKTNGKVKSVEEKEMEMAGTGADSEDVDEELSELDDAEEVSDEDDEEDMSDDGNQPADSAALDTIRASAIGDDELDSDSDLENSRDGTPDPSKQTRRQRAENDELMALSNEAQKKKFFTQEQLTMRRTEMARRRKDLSDKRNEQEKLDTLDRLLHKRAPVRRTRAQMMADAEREEFGTPGADEDGVTKAKAGYVRTIIGYEHSSVGVPEEWIGKDVGKVFEGTKKQDKALKVVGGTRMVQVVE